jgi:hypothetical protein
MKECFMSFVVGEKVFIRTVTYHLTGEISDVGGKFLTLKDAAWVADSGRFMNAIETGSLSEVEPVTCKVRVNLDSIVDVYDWRHELPREQK